MRSFSSVVGLAVLVASCASPPSRTPDFDLVCQKESSTEQSPTQIIYKCSVGCFEVDEEALRRELASRVPIDTELMIDLYAPRSHETDACRLELWLWPYEGRS